MNGIIIDNKFGNKNRDKKTIFKISICIKLVIANNLVSCNNQAIDKKINKINKHDFTIWIKIYKFILLNIL